ncbi:MAG: ABC transporter permease [Candidatus Pacebacteria bacterium]|jgi:cell division transport system permease protein|nr:ABC transporter permease [Candidatus Paceibacterota bacterium]
MITSLRRVFRSGFIGFWRSAYVSLASIFVITVALFVIGTTMLLDQLLTVSLTNIQSKVDINVYFVTNAEESDIMALKTKVESLPDVAEVRYTSREDALTEYRLKNQNDSVAMQALEELGENPLGATIAIRAKETSQYESIARFLDEQKAQESAQAPLIDEVNYAANKESIETLTNIINAVERASTITMIVLIFAAVLITFNTIRLAIYTAREEISVMRLVGASNAFIRGPFMLQGVMYGVIAGVLALAILYPIMIWIGPATAEFFEFDLYVYFVSNFSSLFLTIVGIGVALGLVSSILAITRYLRV